MSAPTVTVRKFLSMQVCVPQEWTNAQAIVFAEKENPCGTTNGWFIKKDGPDPERVQCEKHSDNVHIVLVA